LSVSLLLFSVVVSFTAVLYFMLNKVESLYKFFKNVKSLFFFVSK